MINKIKADADVRMRKPLNSLIEVFTQIRTGKAHPGILNNILVPYYGTNVPVKEISSISLKDSRTLKITPFDLITLKDIDKAIQSANLNLNPNNLGEYLLISMPPLTEETRKTLVKQARDAAEDARISIRNIRRDILSQLKSLLKEKKISEDDEYRAGDDIQKITDEAVSNIEKYAKQKEMDLMDF